MIRRKRFTGTRRVGKLEFYTERGTYSDGTPDGRVILWIRSPKTKDGRHVAYICTPYPREGNDKSDILNRLYCGSIIQGFADSPVKLAKALTKAFRAAL